MSRVQALLALLLVAGVSLAMPRTARAYPVTVQSCKDALVFDHAPLRPVVNDQNMVQTVIDMGLADRFVGFGSMRRPLAQGWIKGPPATLARIAAHQISDRYPTSENLLGVNADFYFAGWNFGLTDATNVTPATLAAFGVKTYVLYESCIRKGTRPRGVSMETMYADVRALGRIFDVQPRAEAMIAGFRKRVEAVTSRTAKAARRPRVMYCGTCDSDGPVLVIGAEGMPAALIAAAGGTNIYPDIPDSYVRVGWESVVARDPEWIILSNTTATREQVIGYLTSAPALKNVTAVKKRQFVFMDYAERSPSTRNVEALERLARAVHPELFNP